MEMTIRFCLALFFTWAFDIPAGGFDATIFDDEALGDSSVSDVEMTGGRVYD